MKLVNVLFLFFCIANVSAQELKENLTDFEKIFGLSKVWKEADKNFVFFDQIKDLDWDKTYQEFIPKVLATSSTYDYYKVLQAFCSLLKDGHTRVHVPWQLRKIHEANPPLRTDLVGDKVYITEILNDTLLKEGLATGMEILEINGNEVHAYAKANVQPYVFYSTLHDRDVQVYQNNLLKGPTDQPLQLKVILNGKEKMVTIDRNKTRKKKEKDIFEFEVLADNIGLLKINRFWGEDVETKFNNLYPEIQKTAKLIIDVAQNSGGNSGYANYVLSHFVDQPFETSRWKTLMYMPAFASWGWNTQWQDNLGSIVEPVEAEKRYTNAVVVLISEETYSAGEDFVSAFLNTSRGKVIGRPTAGTTGNPIGDALPGGGGYQICSKRDYLSNGKEFVGYGIHPDIFVEKNLDNNHLLKKGLAVLKNK